MSLSDKTTLTHGTRTFRFVDEVGRQHSVRIGPSVMRELLAAPGERDLAVLGLPTVGDAMLTLSDEVRTRATASEPETRRGLVRRAASLLDLDIALAEGLPGRTPVPQNIRAGKASPPPWYDESG